MQYRVSINAPRYQIGYGSDSEFIEVATTLSRRRAEQIARLLSEEEEWLDFSTATEARNFIEWYEAAEAVSVWDTDKANAAMKLIRVAETLEGEQP